MINTKGIFRIPAAAHDLDKLDQAIMQNNLNYIFNINDPHLIAGGIKKFFRDMKHPLLPYECYESFKTFAGKFSK